MAEGTKRKKWSDVKARLEAFDHKGLVSLLGELYAASVANRRFLHSRPSPGSRAIEEDAVAKEFDTLPADVRAKVRVRLGRIQVRAQDVGWGFSDAVDDVIHSLDARAATIVSLDRC